MVRNRRKRCASAPYDSADSDGLNVLNVLNHLNGSCCSDLALKNFQPVEPVDEIELSVVGAKDTVAWDGLLSLATDRIKNFTALS
jgi:hypothetical protein